MQEETAQEETVQNEARTPAEAPHGRCDNRRVGESRVTVGVPQVVREQPREHELKPDVVDHIGRAFPRAL